MQETTEVTTSNLFSKLCRNRIVFYFSMAIIVLIVVLVCCSLYATAAAHHYTTSYSTYKTSLKKVALESQKVNYEDVYWDPSESTGYGLATADLYESATQKCSAVQAAFAGLGKLKTLTLASNIATVLGTPFSPAYRAGRHNQAAADALNSPLAAMHDHLARDVHNCQLFNRDLKAQLIDTANQQARNALLVPCGSNGGTCLPDSQTEAYKNLYKTAVDSAKAEDNLYTNDCFYPELTAACKITSDYWKHSYDGNLAYYNALTPGGDFGSVTAADDAAAAQDVKNLCTTLKKQAKLYARSVAAGVSCDGSVTSTFNTFTTMNKLLVGDDEAAIHAAATAISKG